MPRAGPDVSEDVWREIVETLQEKPFEQVGSNRIRTHATAHKRRYHEVVQVKELLEQLGIEPIVTSGMAAFFERSTRVELAKEFATPPDTTERVVATLDALLRDSSSKPGNS